MTMRRVLRVALAAVLGVALAAPVAARQQAGQEPQTAAERERALLGQATQDPQQITVLLDLVRLYVEQGRLDEAERTLRRAAMVLQQARAAAELADRPVVTFGPGDAPVRIGGDIKEPRKLRDVRPVYPQEAQDAGVQGIVILETTIDEFGQVREARVLRSVPMLDGPAIDAVLQWRFEPTLLGGAPVSVIMTVTVNFSLR